MLLLWLALGLRAMAALAQHPGEAFDPPKPNHPWKHQETGLRFPHKLGQMESEGRFEYEEKALGVMLRYVSLKQRIRADIFVYPCKAPHKTAKEMMDAASHEAGAVLDEIMLAQKQGAYSDVKEGDATYKEIDLLPEGAGKSCLLEMPLTLTIHEDDVKGKVAVRLRSLVTLSIYGGYFVKIRCTFPEEKEPKTADMIEEFVTQVQMCIVEPGLRQMTRGYIRDYRADPLSAKARDVTGGILAYAEKMPMFNFSVSSALATLAAPLKADFPDAELDMFRAFIVGAVAAAIQEPLPEDVDLEQEGAVEVVKLHKLMLKQKPGLKNPLMSGLIQAVEKGEGAAWFRAQDAKAR